MQPRHYPGMPYRNTFKFTAVVRLGAGGIERGDFHKFSKEIAEPVICAILASSILTPFPVQLLKQKQFFFGHSQPLG